MLIVVWKLLNLRAWVFIVVDSGGGGGGGWAISAFPALKSKLSFYLTGLRSAFNKFISLDTCLKVLYGYYLMSFMIVESLDEMFEFVWIVFYSMFYMIYSKLGRIL